jgi:hypothetical protein
MALTDKYAYYILELPFYNNNKKYLKSLNFIK